MAGEVTIFISYSHEDANFVDRLEADLRARGLTTWVDRRKLEGTREWQPQIDRGVAQFAMMVVVVSPVALKSEYVRHEYEYAHQLGKRIVPVICQKISVSLPPVLSSVQWVDFADKSGKPYEEALRELIDGCQDPSLDLTSDSRTLYNQAHDLQSTNPERAAIFYQRLLDRDPNYFGGDAQRDLERLNQHLYPQRAQRLRERAETTRKRGAYGAESGALEALIALGNQDRGILSWAEEYLPVAQQNRVWLDPYENIKHLVANGDLATARDKLTKLWQNGNAPFFRDPAGIAPALGLTVPPTYEEAMECKAAAERKHIAEAQAQVNLTQVVDEEKQRWFAMLPSRKPPTDPYSYGPSGLFAEYRRSVIRAEKASKRRWERQGKAEHFMSDVKKSAEDVRDGNVGALILIISIGLVVEAILHNSYSETALIILVGTSTTVALT